MTACTWLSQQVARPRRSARAPWSGATSAAWATKTSSMPTTPTSWRRAPGTSPRSCALPDAPEHAAVVRWPTAMPQYELGHVERVARIRRALPAGIFVAGQAYDGVGIPDCVRAAGETAEAVVAYLHTTIPQDVERRGDGYDERDRSTPCTRCSCGSDDLRDVLRRCRRPSRRRPGDREPVQVVGGPRRGARHVLDGRVPRRRRPDALARRSIRPTMLQRAPRGVPPDRGRAASSNSRGRSWAS